MIRAKTGVERLLIASDMYSRAWQMILLHLRAKHSDWDEDRIRNNRLDFHAYYA